MRHDSKRQRDEEKTMNMKLAAGLAAAGILAGGGTAAALAATGSTAPAAASTVAATASTPAARCTSSALASLVSKGTISQAQATAIQDAMQTYMRGHLGDMRDYMDGTSGAMWTGGPMAAVLRQLVSKGTITQAQATAVTQQMQADWDHGYGHGSGRGGSGAGMMGGGHMGWAGAGTAAS
jgi:polyhydroxyalkanoate synthesis regulator phasin